jgi:hypothetical protein
MSSEKTKNKYSKKKFLLAFVICIGMLSTVRHVFSIEIPMATAEDIKPIIAKIGSTQTDSSILEHTEEEDTIEFADGKEMTEDPADEEETQVVMPVIQKIKKNKIVGVSSFSKSFPDKNDVQLQAAKMNGIQPVTSREEALKLLERNELVNICNSPFYTVDKLNHSMPYLVPKAQQLLNTISVNFIDSLQAKGIAPHMPMITSVLRTANDIKKLQKGNVNATTNSCHCYGTTVDIAYNRFTPIVGYYNDSIEPTRWNSNMKLVLSEVLKDLRDEGKCYVKYERKQGCFHLTVR